METDVGGRSLFIIYYILIDGKTSLVYEKRTQKATKGAETRFYANNEPVCG